MMQLVRAIAFVFATAVVANASQPFELKSTAFKAGGLIPQQYAYSGNGCPGKNLSPELSWSGAPEDTKSFALTLFDPDARNGVGWWHWVVYNIPPDVQHLGAGAGAGSGDLMSTQAVQGRNDFQTIGYGGPCPPPGGGVHHYRFTIYALDMDLSGLSPLTSGPALVTAMHGHILGKAEITGLFQR